MPEVELSPGAEEDLLAIARYTIETWGVEQANRYEDALRKHFNAIGQGEARSRVFLKHWPELLVSRCEHHYVFFLQRAESCPLILAVFHESMDLIARVRERMDSGV